MLSDVELSRMPVWKALFVIGVLHLLHWWPVIVRSGELARLRRQDRYADEVTADLARRHRLVEMPGTAQGYRRLLKPPARRRTRGVVTSVVG